MLKNDYPIIAIVSENSEKALEIKAFLLYRGIFAKVFLPDEARRALSDISLLIVEAPKYSSKIFSLLSHRGRELIKPPVIFIGEESSLHGECVDVILPYSFAVNYGRLFDKIAELGFRELFSSDTPPIVTDLYEKHTVFFRGYKLFLSPKEYTIVHYIAKCGASYVTADEIAEAILISPSSVPVYISSINKKLKSISELTMIKFRRPKGYYIVGREPK